MLDRTLGQDSLYQQIKAQANSLSEVTEYFRANILVKLGVFELNQFTTLNRRQDGRTRVIQRSFGSQ